MSGTTSLVRTSSKDILARLMASENITVEHRADASTAYFDTLNRVLCLPVWQDMDNSLYDMLVGHEVSHALHTPADEWESQMDRFGRANRSAYQIFVNIVEDARIERLIKDKFPGIRRDFYAAYKDLYERDLFEIGDKNLSELPLIDRLNLEFKIGAFIDVPFETPEREWIHAVADTKTFLEVCDVAAKLFEAHKQDDEDEQNEQEENDQTGVGAPQQGGDDDGEGDGSDSNDDSDHLDNEGESSSAMEGSSDDEAEQTENGTGSGDSQSSKDCGQSMSDDTDDGESAESTSGEDGEGGSETDSDELQDLPEYENDVVCRGGSTQNAFDRAVRNMVDGEAKERTYYPFPQVNIDNIITDYKTVHRDLGEFIRGDQKRMEALTAASIELTKFERESRKTVNMMAQQFMRRQAADEAHRTSISKTGMLDMNSICSYKWSEDIFLRQEEIADGKNHGLVIFVDWSGSMSGIMQDTIHQMMQMVFFCRKVGIPFEVYSFTSNLHYPPNFRDWSDEKQSEWTKNQFGAGAKEIGLSKFSLNNYLSNRMNARETKSALQHMMYLASGMDWNNRYNGYQIPRNHDLGCTPLNEAIAAATEIVPKFRSDNRLQIVNTMFLTDGESSGGIYDHGDAYIRDDKTKKSYAATGRQAGTTGALLELLQDRTDANTVGIYLNSSRTLKNGYYYGYTDEMIESYKTNGFASTDKAGYTEYFVVKANKKVENDYLDDLADDASYTRIKNAFMKASSNRVNSRVLLNRVIDLIA